jgi:hypothetical protein
MDFRQSGSLEAIAGQLDRQALASEVANSTDINPARHERFKTELCRR